MFFLPCFFSLLIAIPYDGLKEEEVGSVKRNIKNHPPEKGIAQVVSDQKGNEGAYTAPEHNASDDSWIVSTDCVPEIKDTIERGDNLDSHPHPEKKDDNFFDKQHVVFSNRNDLFCRCATAYSGVCKGFSKFSSRSFLRCPLPEGGPVFLVLFHSYHEVIIADIPIKSNKFPLFSCLLVYLSIISLG